MYLVTASEMQKMDRLTIESFGLPGEGSDGECRPGGNTIFF